jgi:assimilatory nitrate reductase catalytic subunit
VSDPAIRTTCPYCGVGCGVLATPDGLGGAAIAGDPDHPANFGRLCVKGTALGETLSLEGRLLHPEIGGRLVSWDEALDAVADSIGDALADHGPQSVALYVSGQLLTEDYYVANKLMKGFIGSPNLDTNSRLCMASSVAGHRRGFGADAVPGCYEDLELADLVVLVGSNLAWCHPVLYGRLEDARAKRGTRVVLIDPRRTASCVAADLHLPLLPGSDATLLNGLLVELDRRGLVDRVAVAARVGGLRTALAVARQTAPDATTVAATCGLDPADVARFFDLFARHERVVTAFSQGVNQSSSGTDKVNAILNLHLATGRIGRPGMGPFSLTGQPNAMGGREVGALANQLAAHMDYDDPEAVDRVRRFWRAPSIAQGPGPKAVELFERVVAGDIRVLWIIATNPAVSLPHSNRVRRALERCPHVIVSDAMRWSDTVARAHIRLPALAWGEKDGTVTNSERRISRQRAFLPQPGEARPDWWILSQVARRLGFGAEFGYRGPADIFREHAALSGFENDGKRVFDLSAMASIDEAAYAAMAPVQWPVTRALPRGTARLFGDGRFATADGRAQLVPVVPRPPAYRTNPDFPVLLLTGRERDHWHTLNRTSKSPRLALREPEPRLAVHPEDAHRLGLAEGGLARIESRWGSMLARVRLSLDQSRGTAFAPMHWNDQFAADARVNAVAHPAVDEISGQPELKHIPVRLTAVPHQWEAIALLRARPAGASVPYWVLAPADGHWRLIAAGPGDPAAAFDALAGTLPPGARLILRDPAGVHFRLALIAEARLQAWIHVGPPGASPETQWVASLFTQETIAPYERWALLAGHAGPLGLPEGPIVCACHGVGRARIIRTIREHRLADVGGIGRALGAGRGCGTCVPELRALVAETATGAA